jgi:hypothetical protein
LPPLRCFLAMRDILQKLQGRFEGVRHRPRIRGSLHFGPVIIGEIGDIKRAIVFNGDVMNTAARLEELSRNVDGGFIASRAAIEQFKTASPVPLHDLGVRDIRGRSAALLSLAWRRANEAEQSASRKRIASPPWRAEDARNRANGSSQRRRKKMPGARPGISLNSSLKSVTSRLRTCRSSP